MSVLQANRYRQPVPIVRVLVVSSSFAIAGFAMAGCGNTANTTRSSEPITSPAATDLSAAPTSSVTTTSAAAAETSVTPPATAQELNPAGGNNPEDYLMPLVVCMSLQEAQDEVQDHGVFFSRSEDATGQGRNQLIDSNWQVVAQSPAPRTPFGEGDALLQVVKYGEQTSEEMCICFLEAAWHGEVDSVARLKAPELDDLFEYQVDNLLKFIRR